MLGWKYLCPDNNGLPLTQRIIAGAESSIFPFLLDGMPAKPLPFAEHSREQGDQTMKVQVRVTRLKK